MNHDFTNRLDALEESADTDEVDPRGQELTEGQKSSIDAIIDSLSDEEQTLLGAIGDYMDGVAESVFKGESGDEGMTRAGVDYMDALCGGSASVDRERYEEYL